MDPPTPHRNTPAQASRVPSHALHAMTAGRRTAKRRLSLSTMPTRAYKHPNIMGQLVYYKRMDPKIPEIPWKTPYSSLLCPASTRCDADTPRHYQDNTKSCDACLYTGMATCTGLSVYFFKMALLDLPEEGTAQFTPNVKTNKRFFLACGTFWAVAGIYRWQLG